jgi:hypothetical protein
MGGVMLGLSRSLAKAGAQPQAKIARGSVLEKNFLFTRSRGDAEKKAEGALLLASTPARTTCQRYEARLRRRSAARSAITSSLLLLRVSAPPRELHSSFFIRGSK